MIRMPSLQQRNRAIEQPDVANGERPTLDDKSQSDNPDRRNAADKPRRVVGRVSAVYRYLEKRRAKKKQEAAADRAAQSTARATWAIAVLTGVTICVGISQYIIFSRQLDEMRTTRISGDQAFAQQMAVMQRQSEAMREQVKMMVQQQRAWLEITSLTGGIVEHYPGTPVAWFPIGVKYKNIGHTPAQHVFLWSHVWVMGEGHSPLKTCDKDKRNTQEISNSIVFPQSIENDGGMSVQIPLKKLEIERGDLRAVQKTAPAYLQILGCLTYDVEGTKAPHVTGFVANLNRPNGKRSDPDRGALTVEDVVSGESIPITVKRKRCVGL